LRQEVKSEKAARKEIPGKRKTSSALRNFHFRSCIVSPLAVRENNNR
jgi:hypothetical protein